MAEKGRKMKEIKKDWYQGIVHRYPEDHNPFKYNAWPSLCIDERGVLYAAASGLRMSHVDHAGKNVMWLSFNEGKTWTPPIIAYDSKFDDRDPGLLYLGNGKILMSWYTDIYDNYLDHMQEQTWLNPGDKAMMNGYSKYWHTLPEDEYFGGKGSFVSLSKDYGVTWGESVKLPLHSPHGPCLCADGRLVYLGKRFEPEYAYDNEFVVYTSFDEGATWEYTGTVPAGEDCDNGQMYESHIVELPGGRLLGGFRVNGRKEAPADSVYVSFSDDKGKTWSVPKCTGVDGMPPHFMVHSSGAVIMSYSCRNFDHMSERAAVSYDGGETWAEDYVLNDNINLNRQRDMGYPATVELPDGSLITVFYQALPEDWHTSILCTKWSLNR